jgi:2-polyprenyl-3-methyl-5-hydroxy-6-metoxy-1,4-benzoquinol methylase
MDIEQITGDLVARQECPLCGSARARQYLDLPLIPINRCGECDFMYSARIMSPEALTRYYTNNFAGERHMQGQQVNASVNLVALSRLISLSKVKRVLEVGCGYGFLLKELHDRYGIDVHGLELSTEEANFARDVNGLDVQCCDLRSANFDPGEFDVVASFEVIEHIADPRRFVLEMAGRVRPGGKLLIMTDNFESAVCHKLGAAFPKWIPHSHVSHFSPRTLEQCIASVHGLHVEKTVSFTPWELMAKAILSSVKKPSARSMEDEVSTEMTRVYPFFKFRKLLNRWWCWTALRNGGMGQLMYVLASKAT